MFEQALRVSDALPRTHPSAGTPSMCWIYRDMAGEPIAATYRFDTKEGKKFFLPYDTKEQAWKAPDPRPLYGMDRIPSSNGEIVLVEGEKCADTLWEIGIPAVSGFGGANGISKTDLSVLNGCTVTVWPDFDEPGWKYATQAAELLGSLGIEAKIIPLKEIALLKGYADEDLSSFKDADILKDETVALNLKGWDAADASAEGIDTLSIGRFLKTAPPYVTYSYTLGKEGEPGLRNVTLGNTLRNVSDNNPLNVTLGREARNGANPVNVNGNWPEPNLKVLNSQKSPPRFPTEIFGPSWGPWLRQAVEAVAAPVDYVGGTLLTVGSSLVGSTYTAHPMGSWKEPAIMWTALVGNPSSGKSPAMDPVFELVRELEAEMAPSFEETIRQYETDKLSAEIAYDAWKKEMKDAQKNGFKTPLKPVEANTPERPQLPRLRISDATTEAMIARLSMQPKGFLFFRDELAGWFGNFDRYGGAGGDRALWLEVYGGRSYTLERVRHDGQPLHVPFLTVSVLGGIQPDKLKSTLLKGDDDGLPARFLYIYPDPVPRKLPEAIGNKEMALNAFRKLNGLRLQRDDYGSYVREALPLSPDAKDLFAEYWQQHQREDLSGYYGGWWGKACGSVLKIALTLQFIWWSAADDYTIPDQISLEAIDAAINMMEDYFVPMAKRAFGETDRLAATLGAAILERKPERVNGREIYKNWNLPGIKDTVNATLALNALTEANWLRSSSTSPTQSGGRPRADFEVNPRLFESNLGTSHQN